MLLVAPAQADMVTMEANTDRMGADYRRIDGSPSVEACHSVCLAEKECDAFTYVKSAHHCWLKTGVPNATSNSDAVSGVKLRGSAPATVPAKESGNSRTFLDPKINGNYVDNCLNWGSNCQKPAADYFCRENGFAGAISFELANRRPTLVMGDNKVCNEGFCVGFSRIVCGGAQAITPADRSGADNQRISDRYQTWQSYNFRDHYIRHRNYLGEITPISSELDSADSSFRMMPGLAGDNTVSFEAKNYPGYYLRHQGFRIKLQQLDNSDLFRKDASFHVVPGLADPSWNSFESVNFPGRYLRHRDFHLYLESGNDDLFRKDSTFRSMGGKQRRR